MFARHPRVQVFHDRRQRRSREMSLEDEEDTVMGRESTDLGLDIFVKVRCKITDREGFTWLSRGQSFAGLGGEVLVLTEGGGGGGEMIPWSADAQDLEQLADGCAP